MAGTYYFEFGNTLINGDFVKEENENAVKLSIKSLIKTEVGSKIYTKQDYGVELEQFLFEPCDHETAVDILDELQSKIGRFERRAKNVIIEILPLSDQNTFQIEIEFFVDENIQPQTLDFLLNEIR